MKSLPSDTGIQPRMTDSCEVMELRDSKGDYNRGCGLLKPTWIWPWDMACLIVMGHHEYSPTNAKCWTSVSGSVSGSCPKLETSRTSLSKDWSWLCSKLSPDLRSWLVTQLCHVIGIQSFLVCHSLLALMKVVFLQGYLIIGFKY